MKKIFLLAGAFTLLVFSSCKKDNNSNDGNNKGGKTKLLKKVTKTESGATTVFNLTYDGNKFKSFSSANGTESTAVTLDGGGNVSKIEVKDHNDYTTYIYMYNNGIPVSGTVKTIHRIAGEPGEDVLQDDVLTYTVANNQVTKIKKHNNIADVEETVNLTYNSGGNLEKAVLEGEDPFSVLFTWGTKKPGFPTVSKWVLDVGYTLQFFARNEMLKAFYDFDGTLFDHELKMNYTYDSDGYPLTSDDGETKIKFEY
jgi:hypothetical protein